MCCDETVGAGAASVHYERTKCARISTAVLQDSMKEKGHRTLRGLMGVEAYVCVVMDSRHLHLSAHMKQ